ncbi:SMC-Scp complex subunit ScpB [Muricoccus radiodurans]|uniref:SMC-Scp complex subunit ScpB n=1 Tax=Muricoccus radiodurans TaxID=2231721 RepID=UPI003CE91E6D
MPTPPDPEPPVPAEQSAVLTSPETLPGGPREAAAEFTSDAVPPSEPASAPPLDPEDIAEGAGAEADTLEPVDPATDVSETTAGQPVAAAGEQGDAGRPAEMPDSADARRSPECVDVINDGLDGDRPEPTDAVSASSDEDPDRPTDPTGEQDAAGPPGEAPDRSPIPSEIPPSALRIAEALVFASATPVTAARLAPLLPGGVDAAAALSALAEDYAERGVNLVAVAGGYAFRTAPDLAPALTRVIEVPRRLPRAAMEALAIIAWHQPVTRAEIEEIRGTALSQNSLEALLENGLIAPRGKKEAPGRPTLWATTPRFLEQFGLNALRDLPKREELLPEPALPLPDPAGQ